MALSKAPQPFTIEPMKASDLDAVMEIERLSFKSPWSRQVVLVDARRGVEDEERQLYEWLGSEGVPAQIVFTKVDKLSASERGLLRERTRQMFGAGKPGARRAAPLLVSAETGEGVPELWAAILSAAAAISPSLAEGPPSA